MKVRSREMAEAEFVEWAMARLEASSHACFLDSAGAIGPRSRISLLSGKLRGVILQSGTSYCLHDFREGTVTNWGEREFSRWLEDFRRRGGPLESEKLFALFCYEAFHDHARPRQPHPIWNTGWEGAWLWSESSFVYERESQRLSWLDGDPGSGPDDVPQPAKWRLPAESESVELRLGWRESERDYYEKIREVQKDIREGNFYQANLSQRFLGRVAQHPLVTYRKLRRRNPSPFMGVFRWGSRWVVSGSPERLVEQRERELSTRPIAGTRPRLANPAEDEQSKRELLDSEKERAEHLMLVDLARNDLGRIAEMGSVRVEEYRVIESYSHVHHLVSEVRARLAEGVSTLELLGSLFPCGTITGAPKISCMRRLAELEAEARGPYTGAIGYIDSRGELDLNILIRTLIQRGEWVCFHAGGGIVADSQQEQEYLETRHKAMALMEALGLSC